MKDVMSEKIRKGMETGSWIRKMFDEGNIMKKPLRADKVFDLTLGNPIVEPPEAFFVELRKLANSNTPACIGIWRMPVIKETRLPLLCSFPKKQLELGANDIVMTCAQPARSMSS